jgi:hypothetical protein
LLSEKNAFETPLKRQAQEKVLPAKLPSRYRVVQREEKWGKDIKDPLAVRQLEFPAGAHREEIIMTTTDKREKREKREKAIEQIERRFKASAEVKVGVSKGPEHLGVTAIKVFEFVPMVKMLNQKLAISVCDDIIEDELRLHTEPSKDPENNDFMLFSFSEESTQPGAQDVRKSALYKHSMTENLPEEILSSTLGKKRPPIQNLGALSKAICLEHVRDYVLT